MKENIVEFPDRKAIEEEAGAWLIKLDGDRPPSAGELASLREWLKRSPVHRERLIDLAGFWGKMNVLTELAVPLGHPADCTTGAVATSPRRTLTGLTRAGLVAAMVVIGIGVGFGVLSMVESVPVPDLSSNGLYATAVGQQESTTLADGSVVLLNTNSQLKVDYDAGFRNIRLLQGEAHFTVAKDPARPFRVYAGRGRVQAVGTAFSVYLRDNAIDVTVTEGKVVLASVDSAAVNRGSQQYVPPETDQSPGEIALLESEIVESLGTIGAGEGATIQSVVATDAVDSLNTIELIEAREIASRLAWREGMLTFSGDPLGDVVSEISRYTTVSIEFSDPAVKATRIGGRFPIGETDAMFDALEANFGLRVTRLSRDRVLLSVAEK